MSKRHRSPWSLPAANSSSLRGWTGMDFGKVEVADFTAREFTFPLFETLGFEVEDMTHALQNIVLRARNTRKETRGGWIRRIPERVGIWAIDFVWSGIDEATDSVTNGWIIPVSDIVSVRAVAEV